MRLIVGLILIQTTLARFSAYHDLYASPKFAIRYLDQEINLPQSRDLLDSANEDGEYQIMKKGSADYLCFVPNIDAISVASNESTNADTGATDKEMDAAQLEQGINIIDNSLFHCLYFFSGFWTYEYCYSGKISQFHENQNYYQQTGKHRPSDPKLNYLLSDFSKLTPGDLKTTFELTQDLGSSQNAITQSIQTGEICDLTNKPRMVDIVYQCPSDAKLQNTKTIAIVSAHEVKTCQYQFIVNLPQLCQLDHFKSHSQKEKVWDITCNKILPVDPTDVDYFISKEDYNKRKFDNLNSVLDPYKTKQKISLEDFRLTPLGKGFYLGDQLDNVDQLPSIIVGNDFNNNTLLDKLANAFISRINNKKMYYTNTGDDNEGALIEWGDEFFFKIAVYNTFGEYFTKVQIECRNTADIVLENVKDSTEIKRNFTKIKRRPKVVVNDEL